MFRQRVQLPLFSYFAFVAPVLMGFLVLTSALMGPPPPMRTSAGAPVLFKKQVVAEASVQILSVPAPIPVPASALTASIPQITVTPSEASRATQAQDPARKKIAKPARSSEPRDRYAFDPSRPSGTIQ